MSQHNKVGRFDMLYQMLRDATRDRRVSPLDQPFAFRSDRGKTREVNQDNALVLTGRRHISTTPFLAAIVCDGMGGLEAGEDAADLATASAGAVLCSDEPSAPEVRMVHAIMQANRTVFERYGGRAGAVLVAVLIEETTSGRTPIIGWVGDARAYGLTPNGLQQLTRDDTVAAQIELLEGPAPDAMNQPLQAIGTKSDVRPNIVSVSHDYLRLLLVSDGVHRIDSTVMPWIRRHARSTCELVDRLVEAANWQDGIDNATALAVDLRKEIPLHEDGPLVLAWVGAEPRIWQTITAPSITRPERIGLTLDIGSGTQKTERPLPSSEKRERSSAPRGQSRPKKHAAQHEQAPLIMEVDETPRKP